MESPKNVLFIKLGEKGLYEKHCIENASTIKLGYNEIDHQKCLSGLWEETFDEIQLKYKTNQQATTSHSNQIRKFYEDPETTMWITFYNNKLWYCYASDQVTLNQDGTKERKTISGWSDHDANGKPLFMQGLSGRLTKVQGFRGTICAVLEKDYLLHKINGTQIPEIIKFEQSIFELKSILVELIKKLNWKDFEVLIDLIFREAGWSRIGVTGKTQKTIDIELMAPVTGERAIVQIKSESDLKTFEKYKLDFLAMDEYDKYFFVVHSPSKELQAYILSGNEQDLIIYDDKKLAELCISAGLLEWLVGVVG